MKERHEYLIQKEPGLKWNMSNQINDDYIYYGCVKKMVCKDLTKMVRDSLLNTQTSLLTS